MVSASRGLGLGEAVNRFLADLPPEERGVSQREIYKFVRWFGSERPFDGLTAAEIANYAERLSLSDTDYMTKLELVRVLLVYAKKKGWSETNLATHLKARKGKARRRSSLKQTALEAVFLTRQGHAELEVELATLQGKRLEAIDEIRKAAADKDFRENVPLEAAREKRGQLEGRIIKLEETLKSAVIMDEQPKAVLKTGVGDTVILGDLNSGGELRYRLVSPREVDPTKGKISSSSPLGQAILGRRQGEIVEVVAPAGKLRYQIKQVERI